MRPETTKENRAWIHDQIDYIVNNDWCWTKIIAKNYPQYLKMWTDVDDHYFQINNSWNYLNAIKFLNWEEILVNSNLTIVDLGAGTGWLTAFLSKFDNVQMIYTIDSDANNLESMLPGIVTKFEGNMRKIKPIIGLFEPLLFEDNSMDIIVISSALHHSPNMGSLLKELYRVLKKGGKLLIVNENPLPKGSYFMKLTKNVISLYKSFFMNNIKLIPKVITSNNGILYDPILGDYTLPLFMWKRLIESADFDYSIVKTPFAQYQNSKERSKIHHFICTK